MLRLEDISIESLHTENFAPATHKFIKNHNIKTVKGLVDNKDKLSPSEWAEIQYLFRNLEKTIQIANKHQKTATIYHPKRYTDQTLNYVDELNKGNILLIDNPIIDNPKLRYIPIKSKSLTAIKRELSLCTARGDNLLTRNCYKLGKKGAENVLLLTDFYTDQVERQAALTSNRAINLFTYQKEEKEQLIKELYPIIVEYLIENGEDFIWGSMTKQQVNRLLSSINNNGVLDIRVANRLIDSLVNYSTLPELEEISHNNYDSLKRFIKVKK